MISLVTTGSIALRAACLSRTTCSGTPFARRSEYNLRPMSPTSSGVLAASFRQSRPMSPSSPGESYVSRYPKPEYRHRRIAHTPTAIQPVSVIVPACSDLLRRTDVQFAYRITNHQPQDNNDGGSQQHPVKNKITFEAPLAKPAMISSLHRTGSRNLPKGSQRSRAPKMKIIINPNHGVKTVKSITPMSVEPYSKSPRAATPGCDPG